MYYLRTKAATAAIQFTVDKTKLRASEAAKSESTKNGKKSGEDKSDESTANGQGVSTLVFTVMISRLLVFKSKRVLQIWTS